MAGTRIHHRGLKIPRDLRLRIHRSWQRHAARLGALPRADMSAFTGIDYLTGEADDQAQCGDCWNFSGTNTGADATVAAGINPKTVDWSKQSVLDCGSNGGCDGDWPETALEQCKNAGVANSSDYPYTGGPSGACKNVPHPNVIADYGYVVAQDGVPDTQSLKNALLAHKTLAVAVDASAFNDYSGGIMTGPTTGYQIDHAIRIYGWQDYDATHTAPAGSNASGYWLAQNQWGKDWGEQGKLRIEYGAYGIGYGAMWATAVAINPAPTPGPTPGPNPPAPVPVPTTLSGTTAPTTVTVNVPLGHGTVSVPIPALAVTVQAPAAKGVASSTVSVAGYTTPGIAVVSGPFGAFGTQIAASVTLPAIPLTATGVVSETHAPAPKVVGPILSLLFQYGEEALATIITDLIAGKTWAEIEADLAAEFTTTSGKAQSAGQFSPAAPCGCR